MQFIEDGIEATANVADLAVPKSLVDAKGDLLVGTANDTVARQAVGSNNTLVVADSAQTNGLKWAQLTNSMVDAAAAIAYSKLNLATSILNADISASAAIDLSKLAAAAWTTYTPTWTGATTNPAIGNGTRTGRYTQIGKLVVASVQIVAGSTTTFGSGQYSVGIPVTDKHSIRYASLGSFFDNSSGNLYPIMPRSGLTTDVSLWNVASPLTAFSATVPVTMATSDQFDFLYVYEAA